MLSSTVELARSRGLNGFRMVDLLAATGMTEGTFYNYYRDVQAALNQVRAGAHQQLADVLAGAAPGSPLSQVLDDALLVVRRPVSELFDERWPVDVLDVGVEAARLREALEARLRGRCNVAAALAWLDAAVDTALGFRVDTNGPVEGFERDACAALWDGVCV